MTDGKQSPTPTHRPLIKLKWRCVAKGHTDPVPNFCLVQEMGLVDVPNKRCYCCKRHEMRTTGAFTSAVSNLPDSSKQLCLHLQLAVQTQDAASLHPIDGGERNISLQNVWKLRTFTSACFDHLLLRRGSSWCVGVCCLLQRKQHSSPQTCTKTTVNI